MNARLRTILPLAAGLALALSTVLLGNWQVRRAHEKLAQEAAFERQARRGPLVPRADAAAAPAEWSPVRLSGHWLEEAGIYLDNRTHGGRAGYHLLMPLQLADGSGVVLVNRGWVAADAGRQALPAVPVPPAGVLEGWVRLPERAPFSLAARPMDGRLWQYLDLAAYRQYSGLAVAAWTVQQTSAADDGLIRDWPGPDAGVDRHRAYALQWYALAALATVLTVWHAWSTFRRRLHGIAAAD